MTFEARVEEFHDDTLRYCGDVVALAGLERGEEVLAARRARVFKIGMWIAAKRSRS